MSSDESDDLPPPLPIRSVRTSYPRIWGDDTTAYSSDVEIIAEIRSRKNQSVRYSTSRRPLKRVSGNINEVSISTSSTFEVHLHEPAEISDAAQCAEQATLYENPHKKSRSPVATNQGSFCIEGTHQLPTKTASALPTIGQCNHLSFEEFPDNGLCPKVSSPASCDESNRKITQKRPQSKNEPISISTVRKSPQDGRTDQKSIGMETYEATAQNTTSSTSSNVVRDISSNLSDKPSFRNCSPQCTSEKSLKRASPHVPNEKGFCPLEAVLSVRALEDNTIIETSQSHNKGAKHSDTNKKSPEKKVILSPRSARLAQACFGEKPKRTKFSKLIFSSDNDCDVTIPDKMTRPPSRDLPACQTMCSPKVDSDISGTTTPTTLASESPKSNQRAKVDLDISGATTPTKSASKSPKSNPQVKVDMNISGTTNPTTLASESNQRGVADLDILGTTTLATKSPKTCPKSSPRSSSNSCSIGMLFLKENPNRVRPPPKNRSPSKQVDRSTAKVELLTDDGLWSNIR